MPELTVTDLAKELQVSTSKLLRLTRAVQIQQWKDRIRAENQRRPYDAPTQRA